MVGLKPDCSQQALQANVLQLSLADEYKGKVGIRGGNLLYIFGNHHYNVPLVDPATSQPLGSAKSIAVNSTDVYAVCMEDPLQRAGAASEWRDRALTCPSVG